MQLFEYCCEVLEHRFKNTHYLAILDKCYRELTILGFISLGVVFSNEFHLWHDHSDLLAFEFAHLLIFGVSMVYLLTTVLACNRLEATSSSWKRIANSNVDELVQKLETEIAAGRGDAKGFTPVWKSTVNIFAVDIWEDCTWKALRLMFLREFDLGVEFDYSKYVTMKLQHKLEHSLHVHPSTWTLVMGISLLFFWWKSTLGDDGHRRLELDEMVSEDDGYDHELELDLGWSSRRLGGDEAGDIGSGSGYEAGEITTLTLLSIFIPAMVGWFLSLGQLWVLKACTSSMLQMLKLNGCICADELPQLLKDLDAKLEMKHILPQLPMFCDCSDGFLDIVHGALTLNYVNSGDSIFTQGEVGTTMVFICKGFADVKGSDGVAVVGTLSHGDYIGEQTLGGELPRSMSLIARTQCAVFQLDYQALADIGSGPAGFPAAVEDLMDYAATAEEASEKGEWTAQKAHEIANHDERVAKHAERLAELKMQQDELNKDPHLKISLAAMGGAAKGGAHLAGSLVVSPVETATKVVLHTAAHAGVPGTGVPKSHASHERHHSLDRMAGADKFLPHRLSDLFDEMSEITLLFNCFTLGYWGLHIAPVLIPAHFSGLGYLFAHSTILLPALLLMLLLAPVSTKYTCLLDSVVYKDQETIAEVYHIQTQLIAQKNAIQKQLMKNGIKMAHDKGVTDVQMEIGLIAELIFKDIDIDGSGTLEYKELQDGLARVHVYLSTKEFGNIMECIDPNLDGLISCDEWVQFLRASDDQLVADGEYSFCFSLLLRNHRSASFFCLARRSPLQLDEQGASVDRSIRATFCYRELF